MRIGCDAQVCHNASQGVDGRFQLLNRAAELRGRVLPLPVLPKSAAELRLEQREPEGLQHLIVNDAS
jgi:hypothetical protein